MTRRQPPLNWTAERDGFRHAFRRRRGLTLCEIAVDERRSRPDQPKCAVCVSLEAAEAERACHR